MKTTKLSIVATLVLTGNTLLYAGSEGNAQQNVFYGNNAGLALTPGASFNVFLGEYAGRNTNGGDVILQTEITLSISQTLLLIPLSSTENLTLLY